MDPKQSSELEKGLEALGRSVEGLTARLLGPKAIGKETIPETPVISPEADQALEAVGNQLGRLLNATGEALKAHPLDPIEAANSATQHSNDPVSPAEGWSPLAQGMRNLGSGLWKVTESALDVVAPRKPKEPENGP